MKIKIVPKKTGSRMTITANPNRMMAPNEEYRNGWDAIFAKPKVVDIDPATGGIADKKPAGEQNG